MSTTTQARPTTENGESPDPREALADEILELPSPERVEELEMRLEEHQQREEMLIDLLDLESPTGQERPYDKVKQVLSDLQDHESFLYEIGDEVLNVEVDGDRPAESWINVIEEIRSPERVEELEDELEEAREAAGHYQGEVVDGLENLGIDTQTESDEERPLVNETRRIHEALDLEENSGRSALEVIEDIINTRDQALGYIEELEENSADSEELEKAREEIKELKRENANLRDENESLEEENNELQQRLSAAQSAICGS